MEDPWTVLNPMAHCVFQDGGHLESKAHNTIESTTDSNFLPQNDANYKIWPIYLDFVTDVK